MQTMIKMKFRDNLRGLKEWKDENLPITTFSEEACKLYDAALTQAVTLYDEPSLGGQDETLKAMLEADPDFVLGLSLKHGLLLQSCKYTIYSDASTKLNIDNLERLANLNQLLTKRELNHVQAVVHFAKGDIVGAYEILDRIIVEHPTDMHAILLLFLTSRKTGMIREIKDAMARVIPFWDSNSLLLKSYLYGYYSFGLVECNLYKQAELVALKGLEHNPNNILAVHTLAHVFKYECRYNEGLEFLNKTEDDWKMCNKFTCHVYWHKAVFLIELNEYEKALDIWKNYCLPIAMTSNNHFFIHDVASLLYRIELTGPQNLVSKTDWSNAYKTFRPIIKSPSLGFTDAHVLMIYLGSGHLQEGEQLIESLDSAVFSDSKVTHPLLKSLIAYHNRHYEEVIHFLYPIRYKLCHISGSNAQRDVFNQVLIIAALNSSCEVNKKLAKQLLIERKANLPNSPLTFRLLNAAQD